MAKEQYITIDVLIDRIYRHPMMKDITRESILDYTLDFMRIVGVPDMFTTSVDEINITNYRGELPCDCISVQNVRESKSKKTLMYSQSSFKLNDTKEPVYKIQGNVIYTSDKNTDLEVSYLKILTDDNGIPLIPDNSSFLRALELYIRKEWFTIKFDLGEISPQVLQNTQQQYHWAVGDCESEFNRLSVPEMKSLVNMWSNILLTYPKHY